ncbi:MAG: cryptochrome/photolyase family protein [Thermodesulfobacteriota bacterium]
MSKKSKYKTSIFIFRRDLRIYDNRGLSEALHNSQTVIPLFFLEDKYLNPENERLFRPNALQFIFESLTELNEKLESIGSKLYIFKGNLFENLNRFILSYKIEALFLNEDYSKLSRNRDSCIKKICDENVISFNSSFDHLLTKPGSVLTQDEKPYRVFTPFYKSALTINVDKPEYKISDNFFKYQIADSYPAAKLKELLPMVNENLAQKGGRKAAVLTLKKIGGFKNYMEERDIPSVNGTTMLSAHLRFGTISVRELYWKVRESHGLNHTLIAELLWRDFYYHLGFYYPHVFNGAFIKKYDSLKWENENSKFEAWCKGETGFPIVDAGIRQLNTTGWMHNRLRMIVASFLTKDLHIDWRWGENYFRSHLVDYDPFSNNGGWQWAASTGADSQPYFRIFNPWRQQERFDPDAKYIKKWVPELEDIDKSTIHKLDKEGLLMKIVYPKPIVDHKTESEKAKNYYKETV